MCNNDNWEDVESALIQWQAKNSMKIFESYDLNHFKVQSFYVNNTGK